MTIIGVSGVGYDMDMSDRRTVEVNGESSERSVLIEIRGIRSLVSEEAMDIGKKIQRLAEFASIKSILNSRVQL